MKIGKKSSVKVKLARGSSILSFNYRDKDKDLIIPVLSEISDLYQKYSGLKQSKSLDKTRKFLSEQINIYREKSKNSFKKAQAFAIDQDLSDITLYGNDSGSMNQNLSLFGSSNTSSLESLLNLGNSPILNNTNLPVSSPNIAIENARANYANRLKNIDEQIKKLLS